MKRVTESFSKTLLSPPHAIASLLSPMIAPTYDLRVRHGVLGLLKHLTQSSNQSLENRKLIEDQGVIAAIVKSGIWDDTKDALAEVVQMNAFGIVKHLCNGSRAHPSWLLSSFFDVLQFRPLSTWRCHPTNQVRPELRRSWL